MSDAPPYKKGQFVWTMFPYDEDPRAPGPKRRVALNLGTVRSKHGILLQRVVYTTTNTQSQERNKARVENPLAASLGQIPFTIDSSRVARIPATANFFPDIHLPDRGVLGHAPRHLQEEVEAKIAECSKPGATTPLRVYGPQSTLPARPTKSSEKSAGGKSSRGQSILDELKARPGGIEGARAESRASANADKPTLSLGPRKKSPGIAD